MTMRPGMITLDTLDPAPIGRWWAEQTGGEVVADLGGYLVVLLPDGLRLAFQQVDDPTPGKNKLHLDFESDDLDGEVDRLVAGGAVVVEPRSMGDFRWVTFTDPDGNQFCVSGPADGVL